MKKIFYTDTTLGATLVCAANMGEARKLLLNEIGSGERINDIRLCSQDDMDWIVKMNGARPADGEYEWDKKAGAYISVATAEKTLRSANVSINFDKNNPYAPKGAMALYSFLCSDNLWFSILAGSVETEYDEDGNFESITMGVYRGFHTPQDLQYITLTRERLTENIAAGKGDDSWVEGAIEIYREKYGPKMPLTTPMGITYYKGEDPLEVEQNALMNRLLGTKRSDMWPEDYPFEKRVPANAYLEKKA